MTFDVAQVATFISRMPPGRSLDLCMLALQLSAGRISPTQFAESMSEMLADSLTATQMEPTA